jgi:hypothetical protein
MILWLKLIVGASFIFAWGYFIYLLFQTFSFSPRVYYSTARGEEKRGVFYALGAGLMPWAKESASRHLGVYLAGIIYHSGIFVGFIILGFLLFNFKINTHVRFILGVFTTVGLFCGLGLFIRRLSLRELRFISQADDYLANLLVDIFLASSFLSLYVTSFQPLFLIISILLLIYVPLGKIRHCLFFFISRAFFGRFYGRRGVLPHKVNLSRLSGEEK